MKKNVINKKSICFILPGYSSYAIGGYKIVYEYANRFVDFGYDVSIVYPKYYSAKTRFLPFRIAKRIFGSIPVKISKRSKSNWFNLNEKIKEIFSFSYGKKMLLKYDVLISTHINTAFALHQLNIDSSKFCIYFIQDFENWPPFTDLDVLESYKFPMKKICISPWLIKKVNSVGVYSTLIYNGLDFSYFTLTKPIEERDSFEISLMYHVRPEKRFEDSVRALEIVHKKIPQIHVSVFGVFDAPENFPEYFTYHRSPAQNEHNEIYNNSAIYVAASSSEGFGLTVAESMICGCAVACTNNGGFSSMVKDGETGLLSPVFDYEALAKNIIRLITDNEFRIRLAKNGNENIKKFNWKTSVEKFVEVIESNGESTTVE